MSFKEESNRIRKIMNDWDPILSGESNNDEYDSYIPMIIKLKNDEKALLRYLEDILISEIGLPYDPDNPEHTKELHGVISKISQTQKLE